MQISLVDCVDHSNIRKAVSGSRTAITFLAGLNIDADGSPHAYHPQSERGLDFLANAGSPGNWYGIACDSRGQPFVQGKNDPAPGYYVSTTTLQDARFLISDPRRYVDSEQVPFAVLPGHHYLDWGIKLGDVGLVRRPDNGQFVYVIFADVGPADKLGEASIAAVAGLGFKANPRRPGATSAVRYTIFPGSGDGRPMTAPEIAAAVLEWTHECPELLDIKIP